jgi:RNA polymerase sigma-70 factor, ECF subfamily
MDEPAGELNHADLAWARGLASGNPADLDRYERELVPMVAGQLRRRGYTHDEIAEVQQELRVRLLVGQDSRPAITGYQGRGHLRSWVLVAALREAVRQRAGRGREAAVEDDVLLALADRAGTTTDPTKQRYREAFRTAFRAALGGLEPRDRNVLRMHTLDALSIDQIGAIMGVHRATVARWLAGARDRIAQGVRRELMSALGVDRFEAESLMDWVRSEIDLSLGGLRDSMTSA